jgi:uncharacterized membrane protein YkoI
MFWNNPCYVVLFILIIEKQSAFQIHLKKQEFPMTRYKMFLMATALITGLAGSVAFAADKNDLKLLGETKINLVQAIQAAEKHHAGSQALDAGIDDDSFKPAYEVTVTKDGRFYDVQVDGVSGQVLGSREDLDD